MNRIVIVLCLAIAAAGGPASAETPSADCSAAAGLTGLRTPLPVTASAVRRGDSLVIVAIGSSSTAGSGASDADHTYPAQLARELKKRWPKLGVRVINKGIGGEVAKQMVARFGQDVLDNHPDLVIWQTGTNSLLRSDSAEAYDALLRNGIRELKKSHADVVLMDPQYAPKVLTTSAHARVVDGMRNAARELGVGLFSRFAIMKSWVDSGRYAMADLITPDNLHMNDTSYQCIARQLAAGIADAVRAEPLPMAVNAKLANLPR